MKRINSRFISLDNPLSIKYFMIYGSMCGFAAYIYFQDIIIAGTFFVLGFFMERSTAPERVRKEKREQLKQFREFIELVNGSMTVANKAVEVCMDEAMESMEKQHMDRTRVYQELKLMQYNLKTNNQTTFATELIRFAERLRNEEIMNFAYSVSSCYGINNQGIRNIIRNTSYLIREKNQIEDEIDASVTEAKYQALIMLAAPAGMLLLFRLSMASYLEKMYNSSAGVITLWICFAINYGVFFLIQRITRKGV